MTEPTREEIWWCRVHERFFSDKGKPCCAAVELIGATWTRKAPQSRSKRVRK